jgi:hypothetical protein
VTGVSTPPRLTLLRVRVVIGTSYAHAYSLFVSLSLSFTVAIGIGACVCVAVGAASLLDDPAFGVHDDAARALVEQLAE